MSECVFKYGDCLEHDCPAEQCHTRDQEREIESLRAQLEEATKETDKAREASLVWGEHARESQKAARQIEADNLALSAVVEKMRDAGRDLVNVSTKFAKANKKAFMADCFEERITEMAKTLAIPSPAKSPKGDSDAPA